MAVSREISRADRCRFGLSSQLSTKSSTDMHQTRSITAWLPDKMWPVLWILFSRPTASKFPTLVVVEQFTQHPSCSTLLWQAHSTLSHKQLGQLYVTTIYHNTMKPNIPVVDWMFSSSSWFVHLQNKQNKFSTVFDYRFRLWRLCFLLRAFKISFI